MVPFLVWLYFWSGSEQSASPWAHLHLVSRDSPWSCWKQQNVVLFPGGERGSSPTSLFSRALIFILLSLCSHLHLGKEEQTSLCSQEGSVLPNPACGQRGHQQWRTSPVIKWWILVTMRHGLCRDHAQPCRSEHFVFELQYLGLFWPRLLGGCWAEILPMSWAWAIPCVVPCVELDGVVFGCVMLWMSSSGPGSDYICTPQITWGGWLSPWTLSHKPGLILCFLAWLGTGKIYLIVVFPAFVFFFFEERCSGWILPSVYLQIATYFCSFVCKLSCLKDDILCVCVGFVHLLLLFYQVFSIFHL